MAFDCYCAICGVGFSGMRAEPTSQTPLDRRRRWVERRSRALEIGQDIDLNSQEEDCVRSYDPRIVDTDNLSWLSKAHCIGIGQDKSGRRKAFLSGPGYYADAGELAVKIGQPQKRAYFNCYGSGTDEVFPFHWCCYEILLRTLTSSSEPKNVNIDVLYDVMSSLCNSSCSALQLNYGADIIRAQGQYWQCIPGAEYCVRHPTETPGLEDLVKSQIKTNQKLRVPSPSIDLRGRQPQNPFGNLPVELICQICSYLPGESLKALSQASLLIHLLTQDNHFWKQFIQLDMPWFWELGSTHSHQEELNDLNYKSLYLWLDGATTPTYGMEDAVQMAASNRRRIWGVCEELAPKYFEALAQRPVEMARGKL